MKNNEVTNFMYYVFNKWCEKEAVLVFGENLGKHIFKKWLSCRKIGVDQLYWYSELDESCRQKIVDRANELYNK